MAEAWARELAAAEGYVHALVNEGAAAGASLAHSHSQLVLMPERPPAVTIEETAPCRVCELVTTELGAQERVIVAVPPEGDRGLARLAVARLAASGSPVVACELPRSGGRLLAAAGLDLPTPLRRALATALEGA